MNPDQLAAAIAAQVAALPAVRRIYPPRRPPLAGARSAIGAPGAVLVQPEGGAVRVTITVGIDGSTTAAEVSGVVGAAAHEVLDAGAAGARQVTVRIASIDD